MRLLLKGRTGFSKFPDTPSLFECMGAQDFELAQFDGNIGNIGHDDGIPNKTVSPRQRIRAQKV